MDAQETKFVERPAGNGIANEALSLLEAPNQDTILASNVPPPILTAAPRPHFGKICLCIAEDWYLKSHYLPLLGALTALSHDVFVVTRVNDHADEIEALGARVIDFDWNRTSMHPLKEFRTVMRLTRLFKLERPDTVHLVAMKPITLGGLAFRLSFVKRVFVHLSGVGFLVVNGTLKTNIVKQAVLRLVSHLLSRPQSWLFAQNPDDCALLGRYGARLGPRVTLVGGAGVDTDTFTALPLPGKAIPRVGYVGRMLRPKGVHVLVEALRLLRERGVPIGADLYGEIDEGNPQAISRLELERWAKEPNVTWHGHIADVRTAWSNADFAVIPSVGREGMPRAMLEAAACARALIVTDVPGSKHFCRHNIEGLVVPAGDANMLADAIATLAGNRNLRERMGAKARERVLEGFTATHYRDAVVDTYKTIYGDVLGI